MRLNNFRRNSCRSKSERPDVCLSSKKPNRKSWSSRHRYLQYHIDSFSSSVCSPPRQSRMSLCYTSGIPAWLKYLKQVAAFMAISFMLLILSSPSFWSRVVFRLYLHYYWSNLKKKNFSGSCIRWINGFNLFFLVTNLLVYSYLCTGYHSLLLGTVSWVRDVAHGPLIFEYLPVIKVYI